MGVLIRLAFMLCTALIPLDVGNYLYIPFNCLSLNDCVSLIW